jgi:hypothetical protein
VNRTPAVTPAAELSRSIPAAAIERGFEIDAAVATLRGEERRLQRIGLEWPLARCREQRRYWEFVGALHAMAEHEGVTRWGR